MDFAIGGVAAMCACVFTNPLEVVKTRMQLQGELEARGKYAIHYRNFAHGLWAIARSDGITALQKGLIPALWFQLFLNGFRLGTYQVADNMGLVRKSDGSTSLFPSLFFGALGGALGAASGSPFYLIKTQLQAQAASEIAVGYQHKHTGMNKALSLIYKSDGVKGLYRGVAASLPRGAIGSATQMATFSRCKEYIQNHDIFPNSPLMVSFIAANMGGIVMTLCMTPFDVVATRLYNQGVDAKGRGLLYDGVLDCFYKMGKTEGFLGFYKGLGPSYLRLGPHTVLVLVFWDQLKSLKNHLFPNKM